MNYEHLPLDGFSYNKGEGTYWEETTKQEADTDSLPISEILRSMSHEKFLLSALLVVGIGKLLIFARIFQWI